MITVFKYKVSGCKSEIVFPIGAEILSAEFQGGVCFIWAKVNTEKEKEARYFEIFGTGHEMPYCMGIDYSFIDTCHLDSGLVFHVFERV